MTNDALRARLHAQLGFTLEDTAFPALGTKYRGKVRDVYRTAERLVIITTDRVSAFDHVLGTIPWKGEILNRMAADAFERTKDIVPNHVLSVPDPNVLVARPCKAYPVELVVRGYITGSLWRDYQAGKAGAYGVPLAAGLRKDERFERPILTPTTKAELGAHDEPISPDEIVRRGLMTRAQLDAAADVALQLFARGQARAAERGLVLVDTKYELGEDDAGKLTLIDEIHTPDSSRYWVAAEYEDRFARGEPQNMLDKENLRGWLIDRHGFSGHGTPPKLDDEIRVTLAARYLEVYTQITGQHLEPAVGPVADRIRANLERAGLL
ncbi:phosphoribosylaminoimidazolesuccinocarboxamide synthase [Myxococcota bacterium]|nr:phosphoribosylaminoimidazolesuccinocarboxamide synthase [Myxococcota bacterium]